MEVTQFTWRLIVLFTPGILTASMVSRFTVHKEWSNFDFIVRSMLFGLSCYFLLYLLSKICLFNGILDSGLGRFFVNVNETPSAKIIAFAGICSIPIAFVYSFVVKRKWVYRFAKFLGITSKTGGIDEWNDFLNFDNI